VVKFTVECAKVEPSGALGKGDHAMKRIIRAAILPLGLVWVAFASVAAAEGLPNAKPKESAFPLSD